MPASYLKKHRPICSVLEEIKQVAEADGNQYIMQLADEATAYAKSMSAKLAEYKESKELQQLLIDSTESR